MCGTCPTPEAGTRIPYVQYVGPWRQGTLCVRYVPNAGGWYAWEPVRTLRRPGGVRVSLGHRLRPACDPALGRAARLSLPIHSARSPPRPCTGVHSCVSERASPCRCSSSRGAPCTLHPAPCTLHPAPCTLHPAPCRFSSSRGRRREALPRRSRISSARTRRSSMPSIASESLTVLRGDRRLWLCVRPAILPAITSAQSTMRSAQHTLHSPLCAGWCHGHCSCSKSAPFTRARQRRGDGAPRGT